ARAEKERLWPKVWQMAGRMEDIPHVGDYFTYDICDDSIIIVRTAPDTIKAFYNVCAHRGRQLIDVPAGQNGARGNAVNFTCAFHGWRYDLDGKNSFILDRDDWHGALNADCTSLTPVRVDTWGGFIYIDQRAEEAESLTDYLGDAGRILAHFEFDKMRYKWRQWCIYPANWKTAIEAFMEPYHTTATHWQLTKYAEFYAYSKQYGMHSVSGFDQRKSSEATAQGGSVSRVGKGKDPRVSTYELARENYTTINYSASTDTLINAAARLKDELPETASVAEVMAHWMASAKADDAARGVAWPDIPTAVMAEAGLAWTLFPNQNILQGVTFALGYRARPYGDDPDKCIFETYALERYPEGDEPATAWVHAEPTEANWGLVLSQDFANMKWVHKGMKSRGFRGALPNPHQEQKIINAHRNLARFMGRGAPEILKP
ncbi:MAG: aromatic ring-hydroxylating dioxygenase subunit alpha, partial [Alphaproteobacteria bacterium]|nr:aromatic ring-hydroxylating dioxygenase subunit alpha [Alphaproteobacteria bacterium]